MTQPTTGDDALRKKPSIASAAGPPPTLAPRESLLQVESVCFAYGKHQVLTDVSFQVGAGEFVGLIGPNGSGKSTLLSLLMSLRRPTSGRVEFCSDRVDLMTTPRVARLGVGKTFQHPRVFRSMSVLENMMVGVRGYRSARRAALTEARLLLEQVNLSQHANVPAGLLSVGQQKLLDLTRALLLKPRLLLLDEVTAGVHPDLIPDILTASQRCVQGGGSIILVTHELDIARHNCTRLLGLHNGRIIADGQPEDVLANELVAEAYLGI